MLKRKAKGHVPLSGKKEKNSLTANCRASFSSFSWSNYFL